MKIPANLKHKPVFISEDYNKIDGKYAGSSDAKGLSLGLAQWNERGRVDISAKVWRHTGEKWSRQSEELPLHRILDLAILICQSKKFISEAYKTPGIFNPDNTLIDRVGLQGGAMNIAICTDNDMIGEDIRLFEKALREEDERLSERLRVISALLDDMGYTIHKK